MSLVTVLGKQMLSDLLSRGYRHRRFDLKKLASVSRQAGNTAFADLLAELGRDMDSQTGTARILQRAGAVLAPACRKKIAVNLAWNWAIEGARRHGGEPEAAVLELTHRCNLSCAGCCSAHDAVETEADLSREEIAQRLREARRAGRFLVVVRGGEPFRCSAVLLEAARSSGDLYFLVYTNGTIVDRALVRSLAECANVAPVLSILGGREVTDSRRGSGAYHLASAAMAALKREGVPFGVTAIVAGHPADAVLLQESFVRRMLRSGAMFVLFPSELAHEAQTIAGRRYPLLALCVDSSGPFRVRCPVPAPTLQVAPPLSDEPRVGQGAGHEAPRDSAVAPSAHHPMV